MVHVDNGHEMRGFLDGVLVPNSNSDNVRNDNVSSLKENSITINPRLAEKGKFVKAPRTGTLGASSGGLMTTNKFVFHENSVPTAGYNELPAWDVLDRIRNIIDMLVLIDAVGFQWENLSCS